MTQAHKTPGALVKAHPDLFEPEMHEYYGHLNLKKQFFIVLKEEPRGHLHVRNIETGEVIPGLHDDNFVTVTENEKRRLKRKNMQVLNRLR